MSAIGEYVHLTAKGYTTYGIGRPNHHAQFASNGLLKNKQQQILARMQRNIKHTNDTTVQNLEDRMNL